MKPVIKVWCLPNCVESAYEGLFQSIVKRLIITGEIKTEDDLLVLFPPDLMRYGLGREIFVEIDWPNCPNSHDGPEILDRVMRVVSNFWPSASVIGKISYTSLEVTGTVICYR